jgi:antimicrobial peptide system SdpA family protein
VTYAMPSPSALSRALDSDVSDSRRTRRAGLLVLAMSVLVAIPAVYGAHVAMPYNPIHLPYEKQVRAAAFMPEGWKYFTRDPQEEFSYVFDRDGADWVARPTNYAQMADAFGANRKPRALAAELGLLMADIPKPSWIECKEAPTVCLERARESVRLRDATEAPQLCGVHGFVMQKPTPWAWRNANPPDVMPSRVVVVAVQC